VRLPASVSASLNPDSTPAAQRAVRARLEQRAARLENRRVVALMRASHNVVAEKPFKPARDGHGRKSQKSQKTGEKIHR
jgi:hypothetical protein